MARRNRRTGGYEGILPIPNSFPQSKEAQDFNYVYLTTAKYHFSLFTYSEMVPL